MSIVKHRGKLDMQNFAKEFFRSLEEEQVKKSVEIKFNVLLETENILN
jgi:hypothetical protein